MSRRTLRKINNVLRNLFITLLVTVAIWMLIVSIETLMTASWKATVMAVGCSAFLYAFWYANYREGM